LIVGIASTAAGIACTAAGITTTNTTAGIATTAAGFAATGITAAGTVIMINIMTRGRRFACRLCSVRRKRRRKARNKESVAMQPHANIYSPLVVLITASG